MDFPTWIADTRQRLAAIDASIGELKTELKSAETSSLKLATAAISLAKGAAKVEGRGSPLEQWASLAALSLRKLNEFHDLEVVVTTTHLLESAGLDLASLFPEVIPAEGTRVRQNGPAAFEHMSLDADNLAIPERNSLTVPLRVEALGSSRDVSVHFDVCAATGLLEGNVRAVLSRHPSVPAAQAPRALASRIEQTALLEAERGFGSVNIALPQIKFAENMRIRSVSLNPAMRCYGGGAKTSRIKRSKLDAVPAGYGIAVKILQEAIWRIVRIEVANAGVGIFSGPAVTSAKSFSLSAGLEDSGSIKIGCDVVRWRWKVAVQLSFTVSIQNGNVLHIVGSQVGSPDVDVSVRPSLGWLTDQLENAVEDIIRDKIPKVQNISKRFPLHGVRQCDANFWKEFVVFSVNV